VVALSESYVACHAGPPGSKVSRDELVDVHHQARLFHELTWSRLKTPAFPAGYGRRDVRRFRKSLGLSPDATFVVGHYPLSSDSTVWTDIGRIEGHHLLYASAEDEVAVMTRLDGELVPQIHPVEPLTAWINDNLAPGQVPA